MSSSDREYEFWLLGLPGENTRKTYDKIRRLTKSSCVCFQFSVPRLRVGTLDLLVEASSDLKKLEGTTVEVISRIISGMREVLCMEKAVMKASLLVKGRPPAHYLHKFQWEGETFPPHLAVRAIQDIIGKEVLTAQTEVKKHLDEYTSVKMTLDTMERNLKGSLLTRNISQLVKREDFVQGSQHLVTVVVVVPKPLFSHWLSVYELLDDEVVPRSSKLIFEEGELGLFNVTLFKRRLENFAAKARELRFVVRDFSYEETRIASEAEHLDGLRRDKSQLERPLLRLLKTRFSEMYIALTHILALRLFVESVLYYGLPPTYLYLFVIVPKKEVKKTRAILAKEYAYLELNQTDKDQEKIENTKDDYYPYVSFNIRAEIYDF